MKAGLVALALFVASIPLANATLDHYGFVDVPGLGPVASGVVWVGAAFVARDVVQLTLGKGTVLWAIMVGVVLSVWLADPGLAVASGCAFAVSELLDFAIYTPLERRQFLWAVMLSSVAGALVDSALFLWLAFDSTKGWWQLAVAKCAVIALATPVAQSVRSRVVPRNVVV